MQHKSEVPRHGAENKRFNSVAKLRKKIQEQTSPRFYQTGGYRHLVEAMNSQDEHAEIQFQMRKSQAQLAESIHLLKLTQNKKLQDKLQEKILN
jgi:transcription initiation factor IIE alpha subunit